MGTKESDLVLPALACLLAASGNQLTTKELKAELRKQIKPNPGDLVILKNRNDDRLSQVIRNLVSHRTLQKKGFAHYFPPVSPSRDGTLQLTNAGIEALRKHENGRGIEKGSRPKQLPLL